MRRVVNDKQRRCGGVEDLASVYVLRPCDTCVLVLRRTKRQRDGGLTKVGVARRQRRQEDRGEFAGSIQDDI